MKMFTTNTLIFGILFLLAGFGALFIGFSIIDTFPMGSVYSWFMLSMIGWGIGIGTLVGDFFYNKRNRRTLIYDKKYWGGGIFFTMIAIMILSSSLNNNYEEGTPEYNYWNNDGMIFGSILPAGFAFCAFYVIMKKRKMRKLGIEPD